MTSRVLCGIALLFAACSCSPPWTVRPIAADEQPFRAAEYARSVWSSKVVPAILSAAVDIRRAPAGARLFAVKGTGRILSVDAGSIAGIASLDIEPFDGKPDAILQIGPVLRGYAIRDGTGVISFGDFTNQIQFADAGAALNRRALETVIEPVRSSVVPGATIEFAGVCDASGNSKDIVPVVLKILPPEKSHVRKR